ncbi:MAG TPA: Dabb family protein [Ignavibacteriaceae bacterium]|nr:Dabb family protein [Ignavibacteriaceae bacterium]
MIKHIVLWRLNETANGKTKDENALELKRMLEAMKDKVKGIIKIEVGINSDKSPDACDIVLYSEFENEEALYNYQVHPDHEAIKVWLKDVRSERRVVDYT